MKSIKYFTATWCGPCQKFKPIMTEIANEGHSVQFIDIDSQEDLARQHNVRSVPTVIIESGGSEVIAPLFWWSTKWSYEHFGAFWNMRLAGFGIGTIVFGIMAWSFIGEVPTIKTVVCLLLAVAIILIQVTNVIDV